MSTTLVGSRRPVKSRAKRTTRYAADKVRRFGHKLPEVGFPAQRPALAKGFKLVALLFGGNWGYGVNVSTNATYAIMLAQKASPTGSVSLVELYSMPERKLANCVQ